MLIVVLVKVAMVRDVTGILGVRDHWWSGTVNRASSGIRDIFTFCPMRREGSALVSRAVSRTMQYYRLGLQEYILTYK